MAHVKVFRFGAVLLCLAAVAGVILALYNYLTPLTGVTGTPGALLVIVSSAVAIVIALALARAPSLGSRIVWRVILMLMVCVPCFAAMLLRERSEDRRVGKLV